MRVFETTSKVADLVLNITSVVPMTPLPRIVTADPSGPLWGENDEIVGVAADAGGIPSPVRTTSMATTVRTAARFRGARANCFTCSSDRDRRAWSPGRTYALPPP